MSRVREICKAVSVKTVLTLAIMATLCFLVIRGGEIPAEFLVIASAVVTYYFCKETTAEERVSQHEKDHH